MTLMGTHLAFNDLIPQREGTRRISERVKRVVSRS